MGLFRPAKVVRQAGRAAPTNFLGYVLLFLAMATGMLNRFLASALWPLLVTLLAEWMEEICTHFRPGGVNEICCWLTERPAEDGRPSTAAVGQFVLEARAFVAAWERARETYPE